MKNIVLRGDIFEENIEHPEAILAALLLRGCAWNDEDDNFYCYSSKIIGTSVFGENIKRHDIDKINKGIEILVEQGYVKQEKEKKGNLFFLNIKGLVQNENESYILIDKDMINKIFKLNNDIDKYTSLVIYIFIIRYRGKSNVMPSKYHYKFYIYGTKYLKERIDCSYKKVSFLLGQLVKNQILFTNNANNFNTKNKNGYLRNYYCLFEDRLLLEEYTKELFNWKTLRNSKDATRIKKQSGLMYYHICKNHGDFTINELCGVITYLNTSSKYNDIDCYSPVIKYCKDRNIDIMIGIKDLDIPQNVKDLFSSSKNL